jgi:hypothetical protein
MMITSAAGRIICIVPDAPYPERLYGGDLNGLHRPWIDASQDNPVSDTEGVKLLADLGDDLAAVRDHQDVLAPLSQESDDVGDDVRLTAAGRADNERVFTGRDGRDGIGNNLGLKRIVRG